MVETTRNQGAQDGADLMAAARDRGMEQLEGAKGQLADGAERVAAAVERTADELGGDGDGAISGFGRSVASLMRQLAGGLRERDIDEFARELSAMARRNPGVFLAGSVALGFGIARFFKARAPDSSSDRYGSRSMSQWQDSSGSQGWQDSASRWRESADTWRDSSARREDFDGDDSLDLSASSTVRRGTASDDDETASRDSAQSTPSTGTLQSGSESRESASREDERNQSKPRQTAKSKAKPQRASSGGTQQPGEDSAASASDGAANPSGTSTPSGDGDALTGGTGGGASRGGKS